MDFIISPNKAFLLKTNKSSSTTKTVVYSNDYDLDKSVHLIISLSSTVLGVTLMFLYWINRNHYLIRYRGFKTAFTIGCGNFLNMTIIPLLFYFEQPCYTNFLVNSVFSSLAMILVASRYMKIVILNKQNLIKSNFLDINMKGNKKKKNEPQQPSNENGDKQVYFIIEPNEFIKHYDDLITTKVTNVISAIVFAIIFVMIAVVSLIAWDDLWDKCNSKSWIIFLPVMVATFFSLLFNTYTFIYSIKYLSFEKSLDIFICNFGIFAGIILYTLSKSKILKCNGSSYFFFCPFFFCIIGCIIIPLIELYWSKYVTKKKKVSKKEFIKLLTSKKYIEIMKVYSIKYLCVENILFWELHIKLLKKICSDYYEEIKQIKKLEIDGRKLSSCSNNNNNLTSKFVTLNDLDYSTTIMKTNECNDSYTEQSSLRKNSVATTKETTGTDDRRYSTGTFMKKDFKIAREENQSFPEISYETMNNPNRSQNIENNNNYYESLIMENSYNVNIFSAQSDSSNIYESDSTDLSAKNSQSFEVKLNIESSDIKKIVFDQIFKELVIPEAFWVIIYKKLISMDERYIEYYKRIYDIYINPKGVVPMKISMNTARIIGTKIGRSEYTYDMFFPILEEVATLIYEHVYLSLDI